MKCLLVNLPKQGGNGTSKGDAESSNIRPLTQELLEMRDMEEGKRRRPAPGAQGANQRLC